MKRVLIINGPNLNLLGSREKQVYGDVSFEKYLKEVKEVYVDLEIDYFQSNVEGELINTLQETEKYDAVVLNAGGYTHTSVAIRDAIAAIQTPVIEVHISNPFARDEFRKTNLISEVCQGLIAGFGLDSYTIALDSIL